MNTPVKLTDSSAGTASATLAAAAAATTLTDSTGQSGSHDDTLAATTTVADLTGGESPTEAEFNTLLAEVRVICQNASDTAQKIIELVTWQAVIQNAIASLAAQVNNLTDVIRAIQKSPGSQI